MLHSSTNQNFADLQSIRTTFEGIQSDPKSMERELSAFEPSDQYLTVVARTTAEISGSFLVAACLNTASERL